MLPASSLTSFTFIFASFGRLLKVKHCKARKSNINPFLESPVLACTALEHYPLKQSELFDETLRRQTNFALQSFIKEGPSPQRAKGQLCLPQEPSFEGFNPKLTSSSSFNFNQRPKGALGSETLTKEQANKKPLPGTQLVERHLLFRQRLLCKGCDGGPAGLRTPDLPLIRRAL